MLRNQVGVLPEAVACALDLDDDGVVQEPVEEGGGDDGVAEDLGPLGEAAVRGEDHGALLVAGVDELEEQAGASGGDGEVADLVDDEQRGAGEEAELLDEPPLPLGLGEGRDDLGEGVGSRTIPS